MLYGKVLRSPYPHANIKSIDTSKAENLPGVKAVLTHKNAPQWYMGVPVPHARILDTTVRFVGDAVALVAAISNEIAEEALDLIDVQYEPLPAVFEIEEAMKPSAPQLYKEFPGNIFPLEYYTKSQKHIFQVDMGDVEKGFAEADAVVEAEARLENAQNAAPIEAPGVIAEWEGNKLTEWGSFQSVGLPEVAIRSALRLPPADVRLIAAHVGGSFGSKNDPRGPALYAVALAKAARQPVAMLYSKEEHFASYQVRMDSRARYKVGIKKDGTITALSGQWLCDSGALQYGPALMIAVGMIVYPFLAKCNNLKIETKLVMTNNIPSGSFRGFGYLENSALLGSVLCVAMEKVNIDPVEYYKKNCVKPGEKFYHMYMGTGWETCAGPDLAGAIEEGAQKFGWRDKWKGWGKPTAVNGSKRRAVGIGFAGHSDVGEQDSNAHVQLNAFGSVTIYCCVTEFGTGARDVARKIVAEALDVPIDAVGLTQPDSTANPWEWGSTGSRSTYAVGTSVLNAANDAKQKLFQRAAPMLGARSEDLETKDSMVFVKGGAGKRLPWAAIFGWENSITGIGHFPDRHNIASYQAQFVEIEVDVDTGQVDILSVVSATDCGQIIDALALQNQLQGFHPGVDLALREETIVDKVTGHMVNPNMLEYKTRTFNELPAHGFVIKETPPNADPPCPFGAFGVGEPSPTPGTPAISMALYNAIGIRFAEWPVTPGKILQALGKA